MPASSRTPQRWRRSRTVAVLTGVLLLALAGCTSDSPSDQPPATYEATPLAGYDTSGLTLVPGEFCDRVAEGAIVAALGSDATDDQSWQPGTRLPGTKDISNEFGCSWSTTSVSARAWVFAPPITAERATDFAKETVGMKCERLEAPSMGEPSVAQRCGLNSGATLTGIYGLVGTAWVGCEISDLSEAPGEDAARVGEWCVAVLEAVRMGPAE